MSKRAEELAKQLYPDPKLEDYDDILVYRADRDNAIMGRLNVIRAYEQAEKDDLALTWQDIRRIVKIADDLLDDPKARVAFQNHNEEYYYKRVLDEYNKLRPATEE